MKIVEEFLFEGLNGTEQIYVSIPTEPEELKILEFNQFIRKINDPEQIAFSNMYSEIKKQFLASHKFNNARNKIKLTNKYLYSRYLQKAIIRLQLNKAIIGLKEYLN